MRRKKWTSAAVLLMMLSVLLLSACGGSDLSDEGKDVSGEGWTVGDFSFTNQSGESFGMTDLEGDVWLANFIFTNCGTVCPTFTAHMSKLQTQLQDEDLNAQLVSFTVDPERDTPEALTAFAEQFGADFSSWNFLTGYSFEEIKQLSENSFKSGVSAPPEGSDQFGHGTWIFLIQSDKIIKLYNGVSNVPYDAIVHDVKVLSDE